MKKLIVIMMVIISLIPVTAFADLYAATVMVFQIDFVKDEFQAVDFSGSQIHIFEGIEDYYIGDLISMVMDDNDTDFISDDEVINYNYVGWINPETWVNK